MPAVDHDVVGEIIANTDRILRLLFPGGALQEQHDAFPCRRFGEAEIGIDHIGEHPWYFRLLTGICPPFSGPGNWRERACKDKQEG